MSLKTLYPYTGGFFVLSVYSGAVQNRPVLSFSPPAPALRGRRRRGEGFVDEDDVIPDALDALPGEIVLLSPAEKPEKAAGPEHDQCRHLPLWHPDLHIPHEAQAAAIPDVDDLPAPQLHHPALHALTPTSAYAGTGMSYPGGFPTKAPSIGKGRRGHTGDKAREGRWQRCRERWRSAASTPRS